MAYARQKSPRRGRRNRLLVRGSRSRNSSKLRITYDYSDDLNASYRISSHRGNHRIRRYISPPSIPSSKGGKPRADRWHPRWPLVKLLENSDRADGTATERRQGMEKGDMPLSLSLCEHPWKTVSVCELRFGHISRSSLDLLRLNSLQLAHTASYSSLWPVASTLSTSPSYELALEETRGPPHMSASQPKPLNCFHHKSRYSWRIYIHRDNLPPEPRHERCSWNTRVAPTINPPPPLLW